jgi:hypothetical protein
VLYDAIHHTKNVLHDAEKFDIVGSLLKIYALKKKMLNIFVPFNQCIVDLFVVLN